MILVQYVDSAAVSIFVVKLIELTYTVFVNSTNINKNIETAVLSANIEQISEIGSRLPRNLVSQHHPPVSVLRQPIVGGNDDQENQRK